jgi:hypothetical protein
VVNKIWASTKAIPLTGDATFLQRLLIGCDRSTQGVPERVERGAREGERDAAAIAQLRTAALIRWRG